MLQKEKSLKEFMLSKSSFRTAIFQSHLAGLSRNWPPKDLYHKTSVQYIKINWQGRGKVVKGEGGLDSLQRLADRKDALDGRLGRFLQRLGCCGVGLGRRVLEELWLSYPNAILCHKAAQRESYLLYSPRLQIHRPPPLQLSQPIAFNHC